MAKRKPVRAVDALPEPLQFHWTALQIAGAHSFSVAGVISTIKRGELKGRKFGKEWRVSDAAYRDWLRNSETRG